ncbi:conserved exported hypothetical protein [Xanthomonas citri pv. fuscans]|uniref:hypothetical protein n=1 Tax=Xanthomonas citri TaxID=346 RepID=UPI000C57F41F|nr:hypothetical protein [Xanthomonas citri]ATS53496.2 hypothetical protein XcfCFBP6992P_08665 [Xanthomonas citri pv. phaseoli var. fuscans]ATS57777.2 hypothetical protein XcfCFBP6994P_17455 [Xanthomonas citri pv. phaseoli var. fuscans]ATS61758.2 hypothetical protein XcfCFBP6996P_08275 [Xanthomonas citri pv. phaseoli var. fuscans]SOO19180.1 conserved exported hypothetical protein [Xanthomonas citri pv. fuscans]SOO33115.1 conserved exported hypothetical protein [Xanthomonas citri pv. fuscans]
MKASLFTSLLMMVSMSAHADGLTKSADGKTLSVSFGAPTFKQVLHYRKLYDKKPFPDAEIYYFSNGMYKIISQGENHYGVYVLQGTFDDQSYTIRFISLPSEDWGNKTAFHQLTFVRGDQQNVFIQNAIVDTGEAIAQQNGTYTLEKNTVSNLVPTSWKHD